MFSRVSWVESQRQRQRQSRATATRVTASSPVGSRDRKSRLILAATPNVTGVAPDADVEGLFARRQTETDEQVPVKLGALKKKKNFCNFFFIGL